jgi:hypothetical protein
MEDGVSNRPRLQTLTLTLTTFSASKLASSFQRNEKVFPWAPWEV